MRTLPTKFDQENRKAPNRPALIVKLQDQQFYVEQTYQADWAACWSSSNMDWTTSPGDVFLVSSSEVEQTQHDSTVLLGDVTWGAQSFKPRWDITNPSITFRLYFWNVVDPSATVVVRLYSDSAGTVGTLLATSDPVVVTDGSGGSGYEYTFSFTSGIVLNALTPYWAVVVPDRMYVYLRYKNTDVYADGQMAIYNNGPWTYYPTQDAFFRLNADKYYPTGTLITQVMSLSSVPTQPGEWVFDDVTPNNVQLQYEAWGVNTPGFTFPGSWTYQGVVKDGDAIADLKQFWRVKISKQANSERTSSPLVKAVRADFSTYEKYSNRHGFGLHVAVLGVSNLTSKIDLFDGSTIGQVTVTLAPIKQVLRWLGTKKPKNKVVKILAGFVAEGFTEQDFVDYRWGQIDNCEMGEDGVVSLSIKDPMVEWGASVPKKWQSTADDVTYTGSHHCDVIKDIFLNRVGLRDSKFDLGTFSVVTAQTSGWKVTRKITGDPEAAGGLADELRFLLAATFITGPTGKVEIKRWDPNEAVVASLSDVDFLKVAWAYNPEGVFYNRCAMYFGWQGSGTDTQNFSSFTEGVDSGSQVEYQQVSTLELRDKWTTIANSSQIQDLTNKVLLRYKDPPDALELFLGRRWLALEAGDMLSLSVTRAPSSDGVSGIQNGKFQIKQVELNHMEDVVRLVVERS